MLLFPPETQRPNREKEELLVRKFLMGLITFPAHRPASFRHSCTQTEQHYGRVQSQARLRRIFRAEYQHNFHPDLDPSEKG